jgi:hypothetical protein
MSRIKAATGRSPSRGTSELTLARSGGGAPCVAANQYSQFAVEEKRKSSPIGISRRLTERSGVSRRRPQSRRLEHGPDATLETEVAGLGPQGQVAAAELVNEPNRTLDKYASVGRRGVA